MLWLFVGCVSVEKWFTPSNSCFPSEVQMDGALQEPASLSPCRNTITFQVSLKSPALCCSELGFSLPVVSRPVQCVGCLYCQIALRMLGKVHPSFLPGSLPLKKKRVTPALTAFSAPYVRTRQVSRSQGGLERQAGLLCVSVCRTKYWLTMSPRDATRTWSENDCISLLF